MVFETMTGLAGWLAGLLIILGALPLLFALAILAPVPMDGGRVPAGFNPERWQSLGMMVTSEHAPWSLALMAASRLRLLVGGSLGGVAALIFIWIGYAGRLDLTNQIKTLDTRSGTLTAEIAKLTRELDETRFKRDEWKKDLDRTSDQLALCMQSSQVNQSDLNNRVTQLNAALAQVNDSLRQSQNLHKDLERDKMLHDTLFNHHIKQLNELIEKQCRDVIPPGRPGGLPDDPSAPRPGRPYR